MPLSSLLVLLPLSQTAGFDPGPNPYIMRNPTISQTTIVFELAGDLWSVPREGGRASRLTTAPGREFNARFSPDGTTLAFSGNYDGNTDVYVMPAEGGVPKRLTAHPTADVVSNWTPDGKSVLYTSSMISPNSYTRMFTVSAGGGLPRAVPLPAVDHGVMSPDGKRLAYVPNPQWQQAWKRYRGGQTTPIWIADLSDSKWREIPRRNTNDKAPMWIGNSIYYLSDPKGPVGLFRFDTQSGRVSEEIAGSGFDFKSASAGPDAIVLEKPGSIWVFNPKTKATRRVNVQVDGDFADVRPRFRNLMTSVNSVSISPTGQRLVAASRGFIVTMPASRGDARVLDSTVGIERQNPEWSPDGRTIAYVTDQRGTEELALYDVATGKERIVTLGDSPEIYSGLAWSPDSKKILYRDRRLTIWVLDVETGKSTVIDRGYRQGRVSLDYSWSPDSQWVAYVKDLPNYYGAVFLHSLETAKSTQVTDGLADASSPVFDRDGKHLFFMASTDVGLGGDQQDIAAFNSANTTYSIYAIVLKKGGENPLRPLSDEEPVGPRPTPPAGAPTGAAVSKTQIDLEGLEGRIIALPLPRLPYNGLAAGTPGVIFALASPARLSSIDFGGGGTTTLYRFSFADRQAIPFTTGVNGLSVTPDGTKMVLMGGGPLRIVSTAAPPQPGQGAVPTTTLNVRIDPTKEWERVYRAAIRKQTLRFYDPGMHGQDMKALERRYEPFLPFLRSRSDLNYIFTDLFGELSVGHMFIGGGEGPSGAPFVPGGLLGADYTFENGRYRLARVYDGERWNPGLVGPLAQPGIEAKAGEYLLAIDGKEVTDVLDLYEFLEAKAGRQVRVKIGPSPDGTGAREGIVVPIADESSLRFRSWIEDNRRRVAEATGGRVGYVHVPDTANGGWREFMRYYYSQSGKDGIIIDERFNGGGAIADFLVREMIKPIVAGSRTRYGADFTIPTMGIYGPKVMIANELAGSGGDILPHLFRFHKVGPIIGKTTWGAMISNYTFGLLDGGFISAPDDAMYNPDGTWMIENRGTPPDIEVEYDPYLWRQGKDAQLERAITEIKRLLERNPPKPLKRPDYPSIPPFRPAR